MTNLSQRPLPDNTQHSQQTNVHVPGGIRTHNLNWRVAEDLCLRPRGHWDQHSLFNSDRNYKILSCSTPSLQPGFGTIRLLVLEILKKHLKEIHFTYNEEWFWGQNEEFYTKRFKKLVQHWRCQDKGILCGKMRYRNTVHIVRYILCFVSF